MFIATMPPPLPSLEGRRDLGGVTDWRDELTMLAESLHPPVAESTKFAVIALSAVVLIGTIGYCAHCRLNRKSKRSRR